jgi:hypothetical protein
MRALVLIALAVLLIGLRCCPVQGGMAAPRARLPRGHAAPEARGGQPLTLPCVVYIGARQ